MMDIPNYVNAPISDADGNLTAEWSNVLQQTYSELQLNAGKEGLRPSFLSTDEIDDLVEIAGTSDEAAAQSNGKLVFDSTTNDSTSLKMIINGTLYTVPLV